MTRRRWIADEVQGDHAALISEHARHLAQVLRARVGEEFDISLGAQVRRGKIIHISADRVEFELGEVVSQIDLTKMTVALSIFKFDRMEWAIEKCTELGVAQLVPMVAARTEPHLAAAAIKRVERWRRIARQAAEQSRRVSPPEIADPLRLKELLASPGESKIVLSETENEVMLRDAVRPRCPSLLLAVGPEGGWKQEELTAFHERGWVSASLGSTILRVETAAISAVAIATSILEH
ncbi:MAG TPA: RsmE family RNA methyltransferase [Terriglobales bacterium]|nr:RsmE family RNA methyltransferase [Terriglobales bacterium]